MSRTTTASWYTYKGCSPQWALHLQDSQRTKKKKEQGRDLLRGTDRWTTVIQIVFIPVLSSEISPFVGVHYRMIVMSIIRTEWGD